MSSSSGPPSASDRPPGRMARRAEVLIRAAKSYGANKRSVVAGGITYYALVSLFPMLLFALSIAGFVWREPEDQQALIANLLDALPLDAESGRADLERLLESVVEARGTLGLIGLASAAYSGSALFSAVRTALNQVFHVQEARPFLRGKLVDLGLVLAFGVLLMLSVAATFAIALVARFASEIFGPEAAALVQASSALLYLLVPAAISLLTFLLLYSMVAHAGVGAREALEGALLAALGFELLKVGFAQYVAAFGNYDATYGALGFVIILLFFFFLSAQLTLFGAEVVEAGREYRTAPSLRELQALRGTIGRLRARLPGAARAEHAEGQAAPAPAAAPTAADVGTYGPGPGAQPESARGSGEPRGGGALVVYLVAIGALVAAAVSRLRRAREAG